jgi:hypothetical protein
MSQEDIRGVTSLDQTFCEAKSLWDTIACEAEEQSPLWGQALLPRDERQLVPVFSTLGAQEFALGLETIYEGYLLHYGRPRLFAPADRDAGVLLGDYLYAHGLVRVARLGRVPVIADLAELISLCSQLRAERSAGDGAVWAATVALLGAGDGRLEDARAALRDGGDPGPLVRLAEAEAGEERVARTLALHRERVE